MIEFNARRLAAPALAVAACFAPATQAAAPDELVASYAARSGSVPSLQRGQQFFTSRHGHDWSCSTCHGDVPTAPGRHSVTGKAIGPMAPALNPARFTDAAKSEKWFRRNCNDVIGRECSAAEKADVLSWLLSLKP